MWTISDGINALLFFSQASEPQHKKVVVLLLLVFKRLHEITVCLWEFLSNHPEEHVGPFMSDKRAPILFHPSIHFLYALLQGWALEIPVLLEAGGIWDHVLPNQM